MKKIRGTGGGTLKQRIARSRNYFLFVVTGLSKPIDRTCLTEEEDLLWQQIIDNRKNLIDNFKKRSVIFNKNNNV